MEYRGFECYATQVPEELSENGAGKVYACEIYSVEDTEMANALAVFDLVEGKDIPSDEVLVPALQGYVDKHYNYLSVLKLYNELAKLQALPEYQVAAVMAYLEKNCEPDVPLRDDELYVLAEKFVEASGSWFTTEVGHAEYLEALKDLLECGVYEMNAPEFSKLSPEDTLKLLLAADNQVFGTLVEAAAVRSWYRYEPYDYQLPKEDLNAVEKAAADVRGLVDNVGALIGAAGKKSEEVSVSKGRDFEKVIV